MDAAIIARPPGIVTPPNGECVATTPGKPVIPSAAKNLAGITEILRCDQNDKKDCRTHRRRRENRESRFLVVRRDVPRRPFTNGLMML
jgi:hypothetical protein